MPKVNKMLRTRDSRTNNSSQCFKKPFHFIHKKNSPNKCKIFSIKNNAFLRLKSKDPKSVI